MLANLNYQIEKTMRDTLAKINDCDETKVSQSIDLKSCTPINDVTHQSTGVNQEATHTSMNKPEITFSNGNSSRTNTSINKTTADLNKSKSNVDDCRPESIPVLKLEGSSIDEECSNDENSNNHVVSNLSTINKHDHTLNRSNVTSHDYDGDVSLFDQNDDSASSSQHEAFTETRPTNMKKRLSSDHEESQIYSNIRKRNRTSIHDDIFPTYPPNMYHSECSLSSDQLDAQLAEELLGYTSPSPSDIGATPIPLLTPPASPIHIQSDESLVDICEWPSNLAVDNALTAVSKLRPLSLSSLALLVEGEERKEPFIIVFPRKTQRLLSRK